MNDASTKYSNAEATPDDAERALRDAARTANGPMRASLADRVVARLAGEPAPSRRGARILPVVLMVAAALMVVAALAMMMAPADKPDQFATPPAPKPDSAPTTTIPQMRPMMMASATQIIAEPLAEYRAPIDWLSGPVARQTAGAIELLAQASGSTTPEPTPRTSG